MNAITMRELKRNPVAKLSDKLPAKLTVDSQTICIMLPVKMYNELVLSYKKHKLSDKLPLYNPAVHKAGSRVLVKKGKALVEAVVPELDGDGRPIPD